MNDNRDKNDLINHIQFIQAEEARAVELWTNLLSHLTSIGLSDDHAFCVMIRKNIAEELDHQKDLVKMAEVLNKEE